MCEVKRYVLSVGDYNGIGPCMKEWKNGEWIHISDHVALEAKNAELRRRLVEEESSVQTYLNSAQVYLDLVNKLKRKLAEAQSAAVEFEHRARDADTLERRLGKVERKAKLYDSLSDDLKEFMEKETERELAQEEKGTGDEQ